MHLHAMHMHDRHLHAMHLYAMHHTPCTCMSCTCMQCTCMTGTCMQCFCILHQAPHAMNTGRAKMACCCMQLLFFITHVARDDILRNIECTRDLRDWMAYVQYDNDTTGDIQEYICRVIYREVWIAARRARQFDIRYSIFNIFVRALELVSTCNTDISNNLFFTGASANNLFLIITAVTTPMTVVFKHTTQIRTKRTNERQKERERERGRGERELMGD